MSAQTHRTALWRTPVLAIGLGVVAGAIEALGMSYTSLLLLSFGEAFLLFGCGLLMGGLLGGLLGVFGALIASILPNIEHLSNRCAWGLALAGWGLSIWYIWPTINTLLAQQRLGMVVVSLLITVMVASVVWYNSLFWLRREANRGPTKIGWRWLSVGAGIVLISIASLIVSQRNFGSPKALASDPDVFLLSVSALRADQLQATSMPYLTQLSSQCLQYKDAISPVPMSRPAHAALLSGVGAYMLRMTSNEDTLQRRKRMLSLRLAKEGYARAAFVSSHLLRKESGLAQGFEIYDDSFTAIRGLDQLQVGQHLGVFSKSFSKAGRPAEESLSLAARWLQKTVERPVFVWLHFDEPRAPFMAHDKGQVRDDAGHQKLLSQGLSAQYSDADKSRLEDLYVGEVQHVDKQIKAFVELIKTRKKQRQQLLVIVGDRGELLGEHGIFSSPHGLYEPLLQVPLVICPLRGHQTAGEITYPVRIMDVYNTVLRQLKLAAAKQTESGNIVPLQKNHKFVGFGSFLRGLDPAGFGNDPIYGYRVRTEQSGAMFKYTLNPKTQKSALFKLTDDPKEQQDLSDSQEKIKNTLHQATRKVVDQLENKKTK